MTFDVSWTPITGTTNNMTGTSAITGTPMWIYGLSRVTFQAIWTGTPTGVFSVQVAENPNDIFNADGTVKSTVKWTTLTSPSGWTALQPAGAAGDAAFALADLSSKWIRPIYTNASGTGTLTFVYGSGRH